MQIKPLPQTPRRPAPSEQGQSPVQRRCIHPRDASETQPVSRPKPEIALVDPHAAASVPP